MTVVRSCVKRVLLSALLVIPMDSLAHSTERGLVLLLPTEFYVTGDGLAALASFLLLAAIPVSV